MARYTKSLCRLCRREGIKLFLKADRCLTDKCAFSRRDYIPGMQHEKGYGRKLSEYGRQLREKQKAKRIYGVMERQFSRYFEIANKKSGDTGLNLLKILEMRLDNAVYKAGFAKSIRIARQLVNHGKVFVNGKKVTIPSYQIKPGQVISFSEKAHSLKVITDAVEVAKKINRVPSWIQSDFDKKQFVIKNEPTRADISIPVQEQLIVELYSK